MGLGPGVVGSGVCGQGHGKDADKDEDQIKSGRGGGGEIKRWREGETEMSSAQIPSAEC